MIDEDVSRPSGTRCELMSWERFHLLARRLAFAISGAAYSPDLIVAIGRGGYLPARVVADYLDVYDLSDVRVVHYRGMHRQRQAGIRYPLPASVTGKRVLLVDDVNDSGDSLQVALRHLHERGAPAALRSAVLHHKTVSAFAPDFYAEEVREWRWIIYPWALMEDLRSLLAGMEPAPATTEAFAACLRRRHGIEVDRQTLEDVFATTGSRA